jgi:hypothetical protein
MNSFQTLLCTLSFVAFIAVGCKKIIYEDNVPVANAGASQTITLPVDSVKVTGTGTDADGQVVAYLWSQVSGPVAATIVNPGSPTTSIINLKPGNYIFQLMVTDDRGATGVDTAMVIVNPAIIHTLSLQPANNPGEFQVSYATVVDSSRVPYSEIQATNLLNSKNGYLTHIRGLIKFDLSTIPANAKILSANLYLYSHPAPVTGNQVDANFGPGNTMFVQQIKTNWSPATTHWYAQPQYTTENQVTVPHSNQSTQDMNIDVKNMVASMVSNNASYGFVIRLQNEGYETNGRIFVSSYNAAYPAKHPKLVVVYE